jgi:hypothetical protein
VNTHSCEEPRGSVCCTAPIHSTERQIFGGARACFPDNHLVTVASWCRCRSVQVLIVRANFFSGSLDLTSCKELLLLDLTVGPGPLAYDMHTNLQHAQVHAATTGMPTFTWDRFSVRVEQWWDHTDTSTCCMGCRWSGCEVDGVCCHSETCTHQ